MQVFLPSGSSPLKTRSADCLRALNYMYCWPCSPDSQYFYDLRRRQVAVCKSMCDTLFDVCGNADWKGKTLRDSFGSGSLMCTLQGYTVVDDSSGAGGDPEGTPGERYGCFGVRPGDELFPHHRDDSSAHRATHQRSSFCVVAGFAAVTAGLLASAARGAFLGQSSSAPHSAGGPQATVAAGITVVFLALCTPQVSASSHTYHGYCKLEAYEPPVGAVQEQTLQVGYLAAAADARGRYLSSRACPYIGGGRVSAPNYQLSGCGLFQDNTCCTNPEVVAMTEAPPRLLQAGRDCAAAFSYLTCSPCSSRQADFFLGHEVEQQQVRVCEGYCNVMYRACENAVVPGPLEDTVTAQFGNGTALCQAMGFSPVTVHDEPPLSGYGNTNDLEARAKATCFGVEANHRVFSGNVPSANGSRYIARSVSCGFAILVAGFFAASSFGCAYEPYSGAFGLRLSGWSRHALPVVIAAVVACSVMGNASATSFTPALSRDLASAISNKLNSVADTYLCRDEVYAIYDAANYTTELRNGTQLVESVRDSLATFFHGKIYLVQSLAADVATKLYATARENMVARPSFYDTDIVLEVPGERFDARYQRRVSFDHSTVKIPSFADRDPNSQAATNPSTGALAAAWATNSLDEELYAPHMADPAVRWAYLGHRTGTFRSMPGRRRARNYFGFTEDYNPLTRPWYVGSSSSQKDVVILMDCTTSMRMSRRSGPALDAARAVIDSLTPQDRFNVVCMKGSYHYASCGRPVCTSSQISFRSKRTRALGCGGDTVQFATPANKKQVLDKLNPSIFDGKQDWTYAIDLTQRLLLGSTRACDTLVVLITDSDNLDTNSVQAYSHTDCHMEQTCYTNADGNQTCYEHEVCIDYYSSKNAGLDAEYMRDVARYVGSMGHRVFAINLQGPSGPTVISDGACDTHGQVLPLWSGNTVFDALRPYFDYLRESIEGGTAILSRPYIDTSGLGLIMTASAPVYIGKEFQGIVGIDATLQEAENTLMSQKWGTVYAFLINGEGRAIVHPLLRPSSQLRSDPIYPDVAYLEATPGTVQFDAFMRQVRAPMLTGSTGQVTIPNMKRRLPKGDKLDGNTVVERDYTYYFSNIPGTDFSFAYVFGPEDGQFRVAVGTGDGNAGRVAQAGDEFYHRLDKYQDPSSRIPQARIDDLHIETKGRDDRLYPSMYISTRHSAYKLAPSAFCKAEEYIVDVTADRSFTYIDAFMRASYAGTTSQYPNAGCSLANASAEVPGASVDTDSADFRTYKQVRPDVALTHAVEPAWIAAATLDGTLSDVIWRHTSTVQGVFRIYPGTRMPHAFDPMARPWYRRGLASQGRLGLTTPYLDAASGHRISTLASPVFAGRDNGSLIACTSGAYCVSGRCYGGHCSSTELEGVAGIDFIYKDFQTMLSQTMFKWADSHAIGDRGCYQTYDCPEGWLDGDFFCETRCFLVDSAGLLQLDPGFVDFKAAAEADYSSVSLGERAGPVMLDLLRHGYARRVDSIDYQGSCSVTRDQDRVPVTLDGITYTAAEADTFARTRGDFDPFDNTFGCVQQVRSLEFLPTAIQAAGGVVAGTVRTTCFRGSYFLAPVPGVDSYLLVIEDAAETSSELSLACHLDNRLAVARLAQVVNYTCTDEGAGVPGGGAGPASGSFHPMCPDRTSYSMQCPYYG